MGRSYSFSSILTSEQKQLTAKNRKTLIVQVTGFVVKFPYRIASLNENSIGRRLLLRVFVSYLAVSTVLTAGQIYFGPAGQSLISVAIGSALKAIGLLIVLVLFIRSIVQQPLADLASAASKLTAFDANSAETGNELETLFHNSQKTEVTALSEDFIRMRDYLREKVDYIEAQNRSLEDRVKERTETIAQVNKELEVQSLHDPLTGLANRTLLHDRLTHQLQISERSGTSFAFASIDLRKFKLINDTHGHLAGDEVLKQISYRIRNCLRSADTVARMGGDEFAIIFHHTSVDKLDVVIERIMDSVAAPCQFEDQTIDVGINLGIAIFPEHGRTAKELYQNADMAMYIAKTNDIKLQYFSNEVRQDLQRHHALRTSVSDAVQLNQLNLVYQPIVRCDDGIANAVEALVRWQHPELGQISPVEFIPIAESTGAINEITDWVFQQAMSEIGHYDESITVAINLSEKLLTDDDLATRLMHLVQAADFRPERLMLEFTESVMVENPARAISTLTSLKKCGFQISIDDFGTGYSSLSYLARLPIDEVKIDQQFLADIVHDDADLRINSTVIVLSIVALAHRMNLRIVAEGVETPEISDLATQYGVDFLQGYYFSKPIPVDEMLRWLDGNLQSRQVA